MFNSTFTHWCLAYPDEPAMGMAMVTTCYTTVGEIIIGVTFLCLDYFLLVSSVVCTGPQTPLLSWHIALIVLGVLASLVALVVIISGMAVACGCELAVFYGSN